MFLMICTSQYYIMYCIWICYFINQYKMTRNHTNLMYLRKKNLMSGLVVAPMKDLSPCCLITVTPDQIKCNLPTLPMPTVLLQLWCVEVRLLSLTHTTFTFRHVTLCNFFSESAFMLPSFYVKNNYWIFVQVVWYHLNI